MTRFRTGRKLGRTVYIQRRDLAGWEDTFIGIMDTAVLGELVCIALNRLADLDPNMVELVARQVAGESDPRNEDSLPGHPDQRPVDSTDTHNAWRTSVDPDDTCSAVEPVDGQH